MELSWYGVMVVSGLVWGIDVVVYCVILFVGGRLFVVFGSGFCMIYLLEYFDLVVWLVELGVVYSEL